MASIGIATAQANAYNVSKLKGAVERYKDKMAQMKETLRKEERVGQETKRNYVATHLDLEKILMDYQVLEAEKDSLELSNTILDGEKKELERKVAEMEIQRSTTDKKAEESKV